MHPWQQPGGTGHAQPAALAALQDEVLIAAADLDRLQALLADAVGQLAGRFVAADAALARSADDAAAGPIASALAARLRAVRADVRGAAVALQFQDMAEQMLAHALGRLRAVADSLGSQAMPGGNEPAPAQFVARAGPVAQRRMDAGSVELY